MRTPRFLTWEQKSTQLLNSAERSTIVLSQVMVCCSIALRSPSQRMYVQPAVIGSNLSSEGLGIQDRSCSTSATLQSRSKVANSASSQFRLRISIANL